MKSKKSILFILALCLMLPLSLFLGACGLQRNAHSWETEWSQDETSHWHACRDCDLMKDFAAHVYDNDQDATCNVCGHVRSVAHEHAYNTQGLCDCGDYVGQEYSKGTRHFLGTLDAGAYYLRFSLDATASYTTDTDLPEGTYQFYVKRNGEWTEIGTDSVTVNADTDDEYFYLVITLAEQSADIYMGVDPE